MVKVAALQFATGCDVQENLATCLRMIDLAAQESAQLMVLPEFSNHISWYNDADHAWAVAVAVDGEFLAAIADRARRHCAFVVINVSLRREGRKITVSSLCFGPDGKLLAVADKQTLMGHENIWFERAGDVSPMVETPFGSVALFPCRDGVTFETPRALALRGALLFCDSLNSFALDEASLHVPARAVENKVFLVAANKIGPLVPGEQVTAISREAHIPEQFLMGAGESQILAPDGAVLARAPRDREAVICAQIDLQQAADKTRPDGTDLLGMRRPALYRPLVEPPEHVPELAAADSVEVALLSTRAQGEDALDEVATRVAALPEATALAVLPELFCYDLAAAGVAPPAMSMARRAVAALKAACAGRPELLLCTSLVMPVGTGAGIVSVLVGRAGLVAAQPQLHASCRYSWMRTGDAWQPVDLPWGRLALITGDDMTSPELVKVAALQGCHVVAAPVHLQESWEAAYGLPSRAAENRLCVLASSRPLGEYGGLVATLERDFTLMAPWAERSFDGYINAPRLTRQLPGQHVTPARVHPSAANNKLMSQHTDLLRDRPWRLCAGLVANQGRDHDNDS